MRLSHNVCIISLSLIMSINTPATWAQADRTQNNQQQRTNQGFVSEQTGRNFIDAQAEDITDENFPDLIESFDYPNADIADVIKAISELTGRNFIVDPQVRGKITIIAPSQITVAEAYRAFLSALAINGMAVVPSGNFWKIKTARNAQRDSIETYSGPYFPTSDHMITRIIKLQYISADEVQRNLRILPSKDGEMVVYPPTNSIIISDYGSNIERITRIIEQLDIPGFEEQMEVIRIRHAKSRDIADLINQIITKDATGAGSRTPPGVPRFRRGGPPGAPDPGASSSESLSLVISDDRTNSIIVVGNKAGVEKVRRLVGQLDFQLRPEDAGGVYVYYVRHVEAETIASTLMGIAQESQRAQERQDGGAPGRPGAGAQPMVGPSPAAIFGGDVQITADKTTNSLIITASRQDYEVIRDLLSKIDIARDQVYVKAVIMEMRVDDATRWGVDVYRFDKDSNGIGRIGFRGSQDLGALINPANDSGAILGFGAGEVFNINMAGTAVQVTSLAGLISFLKSNAGGNVLSTPQIMALDNEEAEIEVGERIPVAPTTSTGPSGITQTGIEREDVTIHLKITPFISPDTDSVQLKIDQRVAQLSNTQVRASALAQQAVVTTRRNIKTQIVVNSGDTAVLGGLMSDQDSENETKVPLLGDVPIIGWLFKSKRVERVKSNLLVFITPRVIRNIQDSARLLDDKINERIDFIQKHMGGRDPHGEIIDNLPRKDLGVRGGGTEELFDESFIETF